MYSKSKEDFEKVFEVVNKHRVNTHVQKRWLEIAKELNSIFNVSLTPKQWKSQYDASIKRIRKYGDPEIRLARTIEKEIPNLLSKDIQTKSVVSVSELKDKLKNYLTKPKHMRDICGFLKIDEISALGLIQLLDSDGYFIFNDHIDQTYVINKRPFTGTEKYIHSIGETREFEFVAISCSHWGSQKQQKQFVEHIYNEAAKRGIKDIYHMGDIVDGYYKNREEQIYELIPGKIGADEQVDYVVNNWPYREGIKTHLILGNHDETHIRNGGFNIGRAIVRGRNELGYKDFEYLGIGHATIELTPNCRMDMLHPLDGSSYAISYSGQKYMDSISGGDKPNILFVGHHHKALYFPYRNIHYFEVPSMMAQSSWMKRKRIANESGAWFIKLTVDEEGTIVRLIPEHIKQYKFLNKDF